MHNIYIIYALHATFVLLSAFSSFCGCRNKELLNLFSQSLKISNAYFSFYNYFTEILQRLSPLLLFHLPTQTKQ